MVGNVLPRGSGVLQQRLLEQQRRTNDSTRTEGNVGTRSKARRPRSRRSDGPCREPGAVPDASLRRSAGQSERRCQRALQAAGANRGDDCANLRVRLPGERVPTHGCNAARGATRRDVRGRYESIAAGSRTAQLSGPHWTRRNGFLLLVDVRQQLPEGRRRSRRRVRWRGVERAVQRGTGGDVVRRGRAVRLPVTVHPAAPRGAAATVVGRRSGAEGDSVGALETSRAQSRRRQSEPAAVDRLAPRPGGLNPRGSGAGRSSSPSRRWRRRWPTRGRRSRTRRASSRRTAATSCAVSPAAS